MTNADDQTVRGFGDEWTRFDQGALSDTERREIWDIYFALFPWDTLPIGARGMDVGCGSGRWAKLVAPRVGSLACVDASEDALNVARRALEGTHNVEFHHASVDALPFADDSLDFGYSLGVLHHVPDTEAGIAACVRKLKPGAPFLVYLYYAFDNRPPWFRRVWQASNLIRRVVSNLPHSARYSVSQVLAATVYFPLARGAKLAEKLGHDVHNLPLSEYRNRDFYVMRTDALDRFGTSLEQRFTRTEIDGMMRRSGLTDIVFQEGVPYWTALGRKPLPSVPT